MQSKNCPADGARKVNAATLRFVFLAYGFVVGNTMFWLNKWRPDHILWDKMTQKILQKNHLGQL